MAGLEVDITLGDSFEKEALATAQALDKIAASEKHIDALAEKLGVSTKQVAAAQKHTADQASKHEKVAVAEKKKSHEAEEKKKKDTEEFNEKLGKGVEGFKEITLGAVGAAAAAAGLVAEVTNLAYEAAQGKREATFMINAFTGGRATEYLEALDGMAKKLGESVDDVRKEFVAYREAGANNTLAMQLIKARADMIALGASAKTADSEISYVTSAGKDMGLAFARLDDIKKHMQGVGDGAAAAAYATHSMSSAGNEIKNDATVELEKLWDKIGPHVERAAHSVADFLDKLIDSKEGQDSLQKVADLIDGVADAINSENMTTGLNAIKAVGGAIYTVFDAVGTAIGWVASQIADLDFSDLTAIVNPLGYIADKIAKFAPSIGQGLAEGITGSKNEASNAAAGLAQGVGSAFADTLGIHSPSKVFAGFGRNTVQGYELGQEQELGGESPLEQAASKAPEQDAASARSRSGVPRPSDSGGSGDISITIENVNVIGGGTAEDNARSIRQELQLLLTAGQISRGLSSV